MAVVWAAVLVLLLGGTACRRATPEDTQRVLKTTHGCENVIRKLGGQECAVRRLVSYLRWRKELDYLERHDITAVLGSCHGGPARRVLVKALADDDQLVRSCVASSLNACFVPDDMDTSGLVPHLDQALNASEVEVRLVATGWHWQVGGDAARAVPVLLDIMAKETTWYTAGEAAKTLKKMGTKAVPALLEALKSDSRETQAYAIITLGEIGPAAKAGVPSLLRVLGERTQTVRIHPIGVASGRMSFGDFGPGMLRKGDVPFPALAAWALARIGDPVTVDSLKGLLEDKDERIRAVAKEALEQIEAAARKAETKP